MVFLWVIEVTLFYITSGYMLQKKFFLFLVNNRNGSNSASSYTYYLLLGYLSSTSNSPFSNYLRQLPPFKAAFATSNRCASGCLQIKIEYKKFPQMTVIRLKTWDFHTKEMKWWYKIVNFLDYNLVRHPGLRYDVLHLPISSISYWWSHVLSTNKDWSVLVYTLKYVNLFLNFMK